jgi:hypothetical protein
MEGGDAMKDKWATDAPEVHTEDLAVVVEDVLTPTGPTTPTPGLNPPDTVDQLRGVRTNEVRANGKYWILGAHGGAGESTLAALDPNAKAAGHAWPVSSHIQDVVVIAREHKAGIRAAQCAGQHWGSGSLPWVRVIALVTIPSHPGKLHKDLAKYLDHVAGGFPIHLRMGWHLDYHHHLDPREATPSRSTAKIAKNLRYLSTH